MSRGTVYSFNTETPKFKYFVCLTSILISLFLTACGGGGGGGSVPGNNSSTSTLSSPSNVSVTEGDAQVTVNWSAVSGADTYSVYINDNTYASDQSFITTTSTSLLSLTITGLVNAQIHTLVVYASNSTDTSNGSVSVQFTPLGALPLPVTGITVTPANQAISVSWDASTYATRYQIDRSISSDFSTGVTSLNTGSISATFDNLTNGTTLYFRIQSINDSGESVFSNVYSATAAYQQGWNIKDDISTSAGGANAYSNTVHMTSNGDAIASWSYSGNIGGWSVSYVNIYDNLMGWGTPLKLSTSGGFDTDEYQIQSDLSENGDGIAIWTERSYLDVNQLDSRQDIYIKHYHSSVWGDDIKLNGVESGQYISDPDVRLDQNGNALAVWHGDNGHFYARSYERSSNTWSPAFQISASSTNYVVEAKVEVDSSGVFVVMWDERHLASTMNQIFIRNFSNAGGWGATALVNTDTPLSTTSNFDSNMAVSPNGDVYVSWVHSPGFNDFRLIMRKYTALADSFGADITVDTSNGHIEWTKIKVDDASNAILNWNKRFTDTNSVEIRSINVAVYKNTNSAFGPIEEMLKSDFDVDSIDTVAVAGNTFNMFYNLAGFASAYNRVYDLNSETWSAPDVIYQYFAGDDYSVSSNAAGEIMLTGDLIDFDYATLDSNQYIRATLFLP